MPLHRRILIGFVLGAAAGLALHALWPAPPPWLSTFLDYAAEPAGRLFLRLLLMTVLPLVVSSLILGVAEMGDAARLGRVAAKTLALTVLMTSLSVLTGLGFVSAFRPGRGFPAEVREKVLRESRPPTERYREGVPDPEAVGARPAAAESGPWTLRLVRMVPESPAAAAASGDFLGVMVFALLFGLGLVKAKEKAAPFLRVMESVYEASMALIGWVMKAAPLGVAALILNLTARFGYGLLTQLAGYAAVVLAALAFHQFVTYSLIARLCAGMGPTAFWRGSRDALLTAFATSSSAATLPVSLKAAEEGLKVPKEISRFVLTVGASANQNGTALYEGVTALFLAQCFGVELPLASQGIVLLLAVLGGVGTAGVPGGSLPMLMAILAAIGVPPEAALLILGVDRFLDMCRTVLNVTGDLVIAVCVAAWERKRA